MLRFHDGSSSRVGDLLSILGQRKHILSRRFRVAGWSWHASWLFSCHLFRRHLSECNDTRFWICSAHYTALFVDFSKWSWICSSRLYPVHFVTQHAWLMWRSIFAIRSSKNVQKSMGSFFLPSLGTYKYTRIDNCQNPLCNENGHLPFSFFLFLGWGGYKAEASVQKGRRFGMPVWLKSMKILIWRKTLMRRCSQRRT
jgi:hypothetical protein